jgi:hypothetical protein
MNPQKLEKTQSDHLNGIRSHGNIIFDKDNSRSLIKISSVNDCIDSKRGLQVDDGNFDLKSNFGSGLRSMDKDAVNHLLPDFSQKKADKVFLIVNGGTINIDFA